jgi:hypothetical protein
MPAGSRWALNISTCIGMNTVRNNILLNAAAVHGGITYGDPPDVALVDSDYNILDRVTPDDGSTVYTLADWQSMGHELHSLSATAASLFVNPGVDYHLLATAPAVDRGQTLATVTTDIEGDPRPCPEGTRPASDIGCDEYVSAAPAPPPAPANLAATAGNGQVSLTWSASPDATSYAVGRATVSGGPYAPIASGVTGISHLDKGLTNGTTYYYVVAAANAAGTSLNSTEAHATPNGPVPPAPPSGLTAIGGRGKVSLSWKQSTSAGVTRNRIYRSLNPGGPYALLTTVSARTASVDRNVRARKTYYYVVTARTRSGLESARSGEAFATTR